MKIGWGIRMAQKSIIISHRRDFDGIASAAELSRFLRGSVKEVLFTNPGRAEMLSTISKLDSAKDTYIYIADVSMSAEGYEELCSKFEGVKSRSNKIIWLDHHPWPEAAALKMKPIAEMLIYGEDKNRCAAELVYENFCTGDDVCKKLSSLAHLTDFNLRPEDKELDEALVRMSQCIAFLDRDDMHSNELRGSLVERVATGSISGGIIDQIYAEYKKSEGENLKMLNDTVRTLDVGRYKIGIAFADNLQSNMACAKIKQITGANIQIFVTTKDWSAHVRSENGINSSLLSSALGGNGHEMASGFTLKVTQKQMDKAIEEYVDKVFASAEKVFVRQ
jgi:oligoribonuclease NrnB/cAMP/cGMP phosphodiesterase (DHH superfamily)